MRDLEKDLSPVEEAALVLLAGAAAAGVEACSYVAVKAGGEMHPAIERLIGVGVPLVIWTPLAVVRHWDAPKAVGALWAMFGICGLGYAALLAWHNDRYPPD